ncbi:MAG: hypothetical protein ACT6WE_23840, partial [Shinella sp.]
NSHATRVRRSIDYVIIKFSSNEAVDGLWIGAFVARSERSHVLAQLRTALRLIKSYDPYRYKRALARFDKILVLHVPSRGQFIPNLRRCVLDTDFVKTATVEEIASTIVHEATHGELIERGIGYGEEIRRRVEGVCTRQELAFAAKIPDFAKVVKRAETKLDLPAETWSDEMSVQRKIQWLKDDGWPNWMLRC